MVSDAGSDRVRLHAGTAAAVGRRDGFVVNGVPQDDNEGRAQIFPRKRQGGGWELN